MTKGTTDRAFIIVVKGGHRKSGGKNPPPTFIYSVEVRGTMGTGDAYYSGWNDLLDEIDSTGSLRSQG
jgi:hypothetical protein